MNIALFCFYSPFQYLVSFSLSLSLFCFKNYVVKLMTTIKKLPFEELILESITFSFFVWFFLSLVMLLLNATVCVTWNWIWIHKNGKWCIFNDLNRWTKRNGKKLSHVYFTVVWYSMHAHIAFSKKRFSRKIWYELWIM